MSTEREQVIAKLLSFVACNQSYPVAAPQSGIVVGVSNRHIHLSQEDLTVLFGEKYTLRVQKDLAQTGQFAAQETVCIAGPKGSFSKVRVLGPLRSESQVEISRSDAFALGVNPPVNTSGDLTGASDLCVIGPKGMLVLKGKVIIAKRHIHMLPEDAAHFGLTNGQRVSVEVGTHKKCIFKDVIVRVAASSTLEFHIDTDEANAADVSSGMIARLV